jgi:hypothetical protein
MNIERRLDRYRRLYSDPAKGQMLIVCQYNGGMPKKAINLLDYDFSKISEHRRYWDLVLENLCIEMENHEGIEDDWVPGFDLYYGFGSLGSIFSDGKLTFTEDTSYIEPVLKSWDTLAGLELTSPRYWMEVFVEAARYFSQQAGGRFLFNVFPFPSPLDVANLLRGNDLFTDFYESPSLLKELLDRCSGALIHHSRILQQASASSFGGTFMLNRWIPRGILILEDAADLCSPGFYEEFGRPFTQRVIDAAGGAYLHHHALGRQQYAGLASLRGLFVEQISTDPNCLKPICEVESIFRTVGNLPIDLECTPEEVFQFIEAFQAGRTILWVETEKKEEAHRLTEIIRRYAR